MEAQEVKKKPGRPFGTRRIKFIPETIDTILKGVTMGLTYESASANAGINKDTLYTWLQKGREGRKEYTDFSDKMAEAVEKGKAHLLATIQQAGKGGKVEKGAITTTKTRSKMIGGEMIVFQTETTVSDAKASSDWRAAAWILERRHAKEFATKQEVALSNADGPLEIALFGGMGMGSAPLELEPEKSGS